MIARTERISVGFGPKVRAGINQRLTFETFSALSAGQVRMAESALYVNQDVDLEKYENVNARSGDRAHSGCDDVI